MSADGDAAAKPAAAPEVGKAEELEVPSWTAKELEELEQPRVNEMNKTQLRAIALVRAHAAEELAKAPDYPDVTGDVRVYRFLKGFQFNVKEAGARLSAALAWRRSVGIDRIRNIIVRDKVTPEQFPHSAKVLQHVPHVTHHGEDKEGNMFSYQLLGRIDPKGIVSVPAAEFQEWFHYEIEYKSLWLSRESKKQNRLVRVRTVRDMTGLGLHHLNGEAMRLFKGVIGDTQRAYPEFLATAHIINAPWVFSVAYRAVRPMLSANTVARIKVQSGDPAPSLLEAISADVVPARWGGKCTWPEDKGLFPHTDASMEESGFAKEVVDAGKKFQTAVTLTKGAGATWHWRVTDKDISFSATFVPADGSDPKPLVAAQRLAQEQSDFIAPVDGSVQLTFDNSYSWRTAKTLLYKVETVASTAMDTTPTDDASLSTQPAAPSATSSPSDPPADGDTKPPAAPAAGAGAGTGAGAGAAES